MNTSQYFPGIGFTEGSPDNPVLKPQVHPVEHKVRHPLTLVWVVYTSKFFRFPPSEIFIGRQLVKRKVDVLSISGTLARMGRGVF